MDDRDDGFRENLDSIASILASGYLRYRQKRREDLLAISPEASPHGHEVNASGNGSARAQGAANRCYAERRMGTKRTSTRWFSAAPIRRSIVSECPS